MTAHVADNAAKAMDQNNIRWSFVFGLSGALLGSVASFVVIVVAIWAPISIALRRFPIRISKLGKFFCVVSSFYAIFIAFAALFHGTNDAMRLGSLLVFLTPLFLISRLGLSSPDKIFDRLILGSQTGIITLFFMTFFSSSELLFDATGRFEGLSGNANIMGVCAALFGSIGGLSLIKRKPLPVLLGLVSLVAMLAVLFATGMRAMWLVLPFLLAVVFFAALVRVPVRLALGSGAAALAALVMIALAFSTTIEERFSEFATDLQSMTESQNYETSIGLRILMLSGGASAALEQPLFGYGMDHRTEALADHLSASEFALIEKHGFTHLHNGFLTTMIDAGVLPVIALIAMLTLPFFCALQTPPIGHNRTINIALSMVLLIVYGASGMTNILFQHDIMDTVFIGLSSIIIASSAPEEARN